MADFPLCEECQQEYEDPRDRRFHAQPVACDNCGPRIWLEIEGEVKAEKEDALQQARKLLSAGKILAIRGLGGFHLACDATNSYAVAELRTRKLRVGKPFAVMFPTLEIIQNHCEVSTFEGEQIESRERPIVIVNRKPTSNIDPEVSPGQETLGVMLPYTPLHALLLEPRDDFPQALVMTSGNLSDEPIATGNDEARERLSGLADAFLLHNRDIHIRCDDSVIRENPASPEHPLYPLRRSRGYAPNPIITKWDMPQILATGPMLKNTFCLTKDKYAFLSHHIGDLENFETLRAFEEGIEHFQGLFRVSPEVIAYDLHPDYLSTRYAIEKAQAEGLPAYGVQHHHAHIAACMADNDLSSEAQVIGLSYDGTGYGTDGTIWGGEVLLSSYRAFSRHYHLKPVPLPGGDAAIKEPWRVAVSWALSAGLDAGGLANLLIDIEPENIEQVTEQIGNQINCPLTSSMGRLFDAVAALVGVRSRVNYEAQAAIELEALADPDEEGQYSFELVNGQIDLTPMIREIASDRLAGIDVPTISARFHNTITACSIAACQAIRQDEDLKRVALSGGVWQNMVLLGKTTAALKQEGFEVLTHHQVPANDGGVAFGQAVIAYHTIINKE
jgi:hydrogenase maturation protein HypF